MLHVRQRLLILCFQHLSHLLDLGLQLLAPHALQLQLLCQERQLDLELRRVSCHHRRRILGQPSQRRVECNRTALVNVKESLHRRPIAPHLLIQSVELPFAQGRKHLWNGLAAFSDRIYSIVNVIWVYLPSWLGALLGSCGRLLFLLVLRLRELLHPSDGAGLHCLLQVGELRCNALDDRAASKGLLAGAGASVDRASLRAQIAKLLIPQHVEFSSHVVSDGLTDRLSLFVDGLIKASLIFCLFVDRTFNLEHPLLAAFIVNLVPAGLAPGCVRDAAPYLDLATSLVHVLDIVVGDVEG